MIRACSGPWPPAISTARPFSPIGPWPSSVPFRPPQQRLRRRARPSKLPASVAELIRVSEEALSDRPARPAILAREDGRIFKGRAAGASTRRGGEVVFNTSLTGYQEVFTDPSYSGQIVCLTYPHIGNVGTNLDDQESAKPYIEALILREFSLSA